MKLLAAICAMANAAGTNWPGQSDTLDQPGGTCGSSGMVLETSAVNATCTIDTGDFVAEFISVAGAFKIGANMYTGFDGISNEKMQSFLIFWEQEADMYGVMDNSTCGTADDVTITCVNNGAANDTPNLVGNFVHDPRQTDFQVGVMNHNEAYSFDGNMWADDNGKIHNMTLTDCTGPVCSADTSGELGDLFYFGFSGKAGVSNF